MLGLCWCRRAFSCCGEWGLLSSWNAQVSHHSGFCCCGAWALGTQAQLLSGMWNPPGPGIEPRSPALAGRLPYTVPAGKSVVNNAYTHNKWKASSTQVHSSCLLSRECKLLNLQLVILTITVSPVGSIHHWHQVSPICPPDLGSTSICIITLCIVFSMLFSSGERQNISSKILIRWSRLYIYIYIYTFFFFYLGKNFSYNWCWTVLCHWDGVIYNKKNSYLDLDPVLNIEF